MHNTHNIILLIALALAPLATLQAADSPKPANKPNILFIVGNDMG